MAEKKYIAILDQVDPKNPDRYWFSGQVRTLTLEQAKPLLEKGSAWYVWWMDGVNNFIRMHQTGEIKKWEEIIK